MKKSLHIICMFFLINTYSQKINKGIITYKKSFTEKTFKKNTDNNPNFNHFKEIEDKMVASLKQIEFVLKFKNNESRFEIVKSLDLENNKFARLAIVPYGRDIYYHNGVENYKKTEVFGETFLVTQEKLNWTLLNETKQIGKYTCYKAKAIVKKKYRGKMKEYPVIAWYCPQITIAFGPIGISGLPGLILEVERGKIRYTATKIQLNPKEDIEIKKLTKGKKITQKKLSEMISTTMGGFKKNKGF